MQSKRWGIREKMKNERKRKVLKYKKRNATKQSRKNFNETKDML